MRQTTRPKGWNPWMLLRGAMFVAGFALLGYVMYRYTLYLPPNHGTAHGRIFPVSVLLGMAGIALAVQPRVLRDLSGLPGAAARVGLTVFGGIWMTTGLLCARSLASGVVAAPLRGLLDAVHMLSDHVFLPLGVAALAWAPSRTARWLGGESWNSMPVRGAPGTTSV